MPFRTLSIACLLALAPLPALARPGLNQEGLARLDTYEVITFTNPGVEGINVGKAMAVFDATPDEVFRVLTDYAHYPDFAPRIVNARVLDRQGDARAFVWLQTDLPWPVSDAWVVAEFDDEQLPDQTYRIRFYQQRGSMKRYEGSILIEPWVKWKNGGKSVVTYELLAVPDSSAPRKTINKRVEEAVGKYMHALRQHINDLRAAHLIHPQLPPQPMVSPLVKARPPLPVENVAEKAP